MHIEIARIYSAVIYNYLLIDIYQLIAIHGKQVDIYCSPSASSPPRRILSIRQIYLI